MEAKTTDPIQVGPGIRRIRAANPSPMTFTGTNTYLLGETEIAVIDPGPDDPAHLASILAALGPGQRISHILVTHSHLDHSPMAPPLAAVTGALIHGFGPSDAGRSKVMRELATANLALAGGEGVDANFAPDVRLNHGSEVGAAGWRLKVLHTPGHLGNHVAFAHDVSGTVFTGDHVMGWASSLVSPPDGDLTDFMASLDLLLSRTCDRRYMPGHGETVETPLARVAELRDHRQGRERAILEALANGSASSAELAQKIYTDVNPALLPAAARNVFAHLIDLTQRNLVGTDQLLSHEARFFRL